MHIHTYNMDTQDRLPSGIGKLNWLNVIRVNSVLLKTLPQFHCLIDLYSGVICGGGGVIYDFVDYRMFNDNGVV